MRHKNMNTDMTVYLSQHREEMPSWLANYGKGGSITFTDLMSGRVGYYPGSGLDGTLMKVGNQSQAVHSFLYVDYGLRRKDLLIHLSQPHSIHGYHCIGRIDWKEEDILPGGEYPLNVDARPRFHPSTFVLEDERPYCFTVVMERNAEKGEDWGALRFAITFLFADGIATYYQLFCQEYRKAPWIMLLQDHGFGGNYDRFGKGGILDAIITDSKVRPHYVLCDHERGVWDGYRKVPEVAPVIGGMHLNTRHLYCDTRQYN